MSNSDYPRKGAIFGKILFTNNAIYHIVDLGVSKNWHFVPAQYAFFHIIPADVQRQKVIAVLPAYNAALP